MASPFKGLDLRSKLFLWSLAVLLAGIVFYSNKDRLTLELDTVLEENSLTVNFSSVSDTVETFLNEDPDQDKLINSLELLLGGDIENPDTDGDGFSDYDEFLGGYDLTTKREEAYTIEELDEYFSEFDQEFGQFIQIRDFYFEQRAEALIAEGREDEAELLIQQISTDDSLTE